jgi:hypothetical protein
MGFIRYPSRRNDKKTDGKPHTIGNAELYDGPEFFCGVEYPAIFTGISLTQPDQGIRLHSRHP